MISFKKYIFGKVSLPYQIQRRGKSIFWSNKYHIFISGQKCLTTSDSPDSNAECKFPWKFNGNLLNGCTDETDPDGK